MPIDRRSRIAASIITALTAISIWLSAGTLAIGGDTTRIAALPPIWILAALVAAAIAIAIVARLELHQSWPLAISLLLWLPFIPGSVPAAFLLWQGPMEWVIWALVIAGFVAPRPINVPALVTDPAKAPIVAALLLAITAFAVFTRVPDVIPGGDEPHYLAATQSLIKDADLRVANNYASGDYLHYFPGRLEPHFLRRSTSGEIYSIHAPGVSVIVLPAFLVAGYPGAVVTMILFAALTAFLTWRLSWRLSGSVSGAWLGTAGVFLTAPSFFHTFTIYPEIIASFCVLCGAGLLLQLEDEHEVGTRALIGVSVALAILPWLHSRFAIIAALLGVFVIARLLSRPGGMKHVFAFAAIPAIAAIGWFAFFWTIWGSPSPAAPYGADTSTSAAYVLRGLIGLLIDQQFGVMTTAPVYLAAIAGACVLARKRPRLTIELTIVAVVYAIAVASYAMWWAGSAAPARFLVAILPLAAPAIASASSTMSVIALIVSMALAAPRAVVDGGRLIFNARSTFDPTLEWLSRLVDFTLALPSVHRDGGAIAIRDASVWAVVIVVATLAVRSLKPRAVEWASASIALAASVMIASTTVWALHSGSIITPDRSKLAALAAWRSWHTTFVDVSRSRSIAPADAFQALSIQLPNGNGRVDRLPAAEYHVSPAGSLRMVAGRNDQPIAFAGDSLRLPVTLRSPSIQSGGVTLTPSGLVDAATTRTAIHAASYGAVHAFFFDERAYPERDGFWTRGHARTAVAIDSPQGGTSGLSLSVTAGSVPTTIQFSMSGWHQSLSLDAGQKQDVTLPPSSGNVWMLSIQSGAGFRPSERDLGNRDVRLLAAWITLKP